ncbi:MAG TPA: Ig-like domain-containing protein [Candidatus Saccharimonadales bacterium]|nr:Ig-like domain-containing protein [Candidatus Saccharimonadales bacterium]
MPKTAATKSKKTTKRPSSQKQTHLFGLKAHHAGGLLLLIAGLLWGLATLLSQPTPRGEAASCTVSNKLVNSCRPWLSAAVGGYNAGGNSQFAFFNKRLNNPDVLTNPNSQVTISRKMDVPHVYHQGGQTLFNGSAREALTDTNLYPDPSNPVLVNWKPGNKWADIANGKDDAAIIASAKAVKELGSRKIFLTLWHEPENHGDVSAAGITFAGNCKRPDGTRGSAADYRAMWRHVRQVFDQQGVTNVVWFWNLTGYVGNNAWDCLVKPLWPGNDIVDWIMWDPYSSESGDFVGSVSKFYNFLTENTDSQHSFTSKPWGLAEFGSNSDPAKAAGYWNKAKEAIGTNWENNKFPNIKLYSVFDTSNNGGTNGGLRVGYNNQGAVDKTEQAAFNDFAKAVLNFQGQPTNAGGGSGGGNSGGGGSSTPAKDTSPPTVTLTEPASGTTKSGTITIRGTASDNKKVTAVTLRIDNKWVQTDENAPYEFRLDTKKYQNGQHDLVLRAWDAAGNMSQSTTATLTFKNGTNGGDYIPPAPSTAVISANKSSSKAIKAASLIIVNPTAAGNSIKVWVNDKLLPNNTIDTTSLTNGTYTVTIEENGKISTRVISVKNPPLLAALNIARADGQLYIGIFIVIAGVAAAWIGRTYVTGFTSHKERRLVRSQRRIK